VQLIILNSIRPCIRKFSDEIFYVKPEVADGLYLFRRIAQKAPLRFRFNFEFLLKSNFNSL